MGNKLRKEAYVRKYKEKYNKYSDPYNAPFDGEVTDLDLIHI
jgi:hypothetical protein